MSDAAIYLDSWWEPNADAIRWAVTHGFAGWLGYFAQRAGDRIYHGWADATFRAIKAAGLVTGDFCSGLDDPAWVRARCTQLGIIGILDVEGSIRGDGAWVDPWLAASGERLYGTSATIAAHAGHGHPGYVLAGYPSNSGVADPIDPGLTWGTVAAPHPPRPIGRQFAGGVPTPFGPVDYSHFAAGFFAPAAPPAPVPVHEVIDMAAVQMWDATSAPWQGNQVWAWVNGAGELRERWAVPGDKASAGEATVATGCAPNSDVGMRIDAAAETVHLNVRTAAGGVLHAYGVKKAAWGLDTFA